MGSRAAITVLKPREEVERHWQGSSHGAGHFDSAPAEVRFTEAPGDRGTEVHIALEKVHGGKLGEAARKLTGSDPRAQAMDALRRFKQELETGVIARSEGAPEGELAKRKLKQRPAQPLDDRETVKAGV